MRKETTVHEEEQLYACLCSCLMVSHLICASLYFCLACRFCSVCMCVPMCISKNILLLEYQLFNFVAVNVFFAQGITPGHTLLPKDTDKPNISLRLVIVQYQTEVLSTIGKSSTDISASACSFARFLNFLMAGVM